MLTVRGLVAEVGLELATGEDGADVPVRWVHISELPDPTPWLSGGELLLTTGIQLGSEERQREFVRLLSGHHLAGLGFGTGFDHDGLPDALVEEAGRLDFPVFEVPYELPFIALTEKAFTRLVNEQYEVLQRGIAIHKRLERLVLEERGLDEVVRALAATTGGAVWVLSARGETIAATRFRRQVPEAALEYVREEVRRRSGGLGSPREGAGAGRTGAGLSDEALEFAPDHPDIAGRSLVLPVSIRGRGGPQAWLVAARDAGGLGDFERLILQQAVTVVALELMRQRAMRDTERRLAGDVLAEALTGRLSESELAVRLRPFGVGASAAVLVFARQDRPPAGGKGPGSARLERSPPCARGRARPAPERYLPCARGRARPALERSLSPRRRATSTVSWPTPAWVRSWPRASGSSAPWSTRATAWIPWPSRRGHARRSNPSTASFARRRPGRPPSARSGARSTRRAAPSRRRRSQTASRRRSPPTATSAPSSSCCRFRTTRRCGSTATACWDRSRTRAASTATS